MELKIEKSKEYLGCYNLTVNGKVEIKNESMAVVDHVYYRLLGYGQQFTEADEIADAILAKQIY